MYDNRQKKKQNRKEACGWCGGMFHKLYSRENSAGKKFYATNTRTEKIKKIPCGLEISKEELMKASNQAVLGLLHPNCNKVTRRHSQQSKESRKAN